MALNIVTSVQPIKIENVVTFIYGDPGIGKTSLAFSAKNAVLFDFDEGAHRAGKYRKSDTVPIRNWNEVARLNIRDFDSYDTIIIDTAGRCLDMITATLKGDSKNTRRDGQLTMQGYGKLGAIFADWLKTLRSFGKDIIILAHASEDKDGDNIIKRPDMVGGSKKEAYKIADMMGYMTVQDGNNGTIRRLNFIPSTAYLAKDSGSIGNITIESLDTHPDQMADIIHATKEHINSLSEEAAKAQKDLDDIRVEMMGIEDAEHINTLIEGLKPSHPFFRQMKMDIWNAAKKLDYIKFDDSEKCFIDVVNEVESLSESLSGNEADEDSESNEGVVDAT